MYFKEIRERHSDWKAVHVFSILNPWLDCVVFVPEERVNACKQACAYGLADYWGYQFEAYGDCLAARLEDEDVPYEIVFGELNWDESNTTIAWDEAVNMLAQMGILVEVVR